MERRSRSGNVQKKALASSDATCGTACAPAHLCGVPSVRTTRTDARTRHTCSWVNVTDRATPDVSSGIGRGQSIGRRSTSWTMNGTWPEARGGGHEKRFREGAGTGKRSTERRRCPVGAPGRDVSLRGRHERDGAPSLGRGTCRCAYRVLEQVRPLGGGDGLGAVAVQVLKRPVLVTVVRPDGVLATPAAPHPPPHSNTGGRLARGGGNTIGASTSLRAASGVPARPGHRPGACA